MKIGKLLAVVTATLVLGFVVGNLASAGAVTDNTAGTTNVVAACGMQIGQSVRDAGGRLADIVAKLTGQSVEDVQEARQNGESFEAIAGEAGVSADDVVAQALEVRKTALDAKVAAGDITQEEADAAYERMSDRIQDRITSTAPGCGGAGGGMGGGRGGRGMGAGGCGGGACGAGTSTAPTTY